MDQLDILGIKFTSEVKILFTEYVRILVFHCGKKFVFAKHL